METNDKDLTEAVLDLSRHRARCWIDRRPRTVEQPRNPLAQIEEIIITAEFREANVQETPIAITAVTGDMLDNRAQTNLYEVTNQAPNVTLKPGGQARSGMMAYIRGVGQSDFIAALEPGVGVYVDDVYYAQLTGSTARAPGRGPGRSAAWTAGHAVRPQLDRRRDQVVYEAAGRR